MKKQIKNILSRGLLTGYVGETKRELVSRDGFPFEASTYSGPEGHYHDEWAAHRSGGGQEVVEIGGKKYTRVYSGGTILLEKLQELDIPEGEKSVGEHLVGFIKKLGSATRLDEDASAEDGKWSYSYKVVDKEDLIPVVLGKEEIRYEGKLVFVHYHVMCPVE